MGLGFTELVSGESAGVGVSIFPSGFEELFRGRGGGVGGEQGFGVLVGKVADG